ncbi:MAG: right-handed parallel beta-helix repeat-containing protein, partial [Planctomycetota bacterium]
IEIYDIPSRPDEIRGNIVIENNTIEDARTVGIRVRRAAEVRISNNIITEPMLGRGMWLRNVTNAAITNNTITGEMLRGIQFSDTSDSVISNNMIYRVISPPWHKWWNGAIAIDYGENNIVRDNEITGEGRSAIHLHGTRDNSILNNDCSGYTGRWSEPKENWNVCQFWDGSYSSGNTVSGNIWGPLAAESTLATVVISERFGTSPSNDSILNNDYRQYSNVPGWTEANPDGPGCVLLMEGTENTLVFESGRFPNDTDAKSQILDFGINNRVIGHDTDGVIAPGIGQRLREIKAAIDALPEEVEEEGEAWPEE